MMLLLMGDNLVIGLTHENLLAMASGEVLQAPGEVEGLTVYFCTGKDHETMRAALREAGHNVPEGNGNGGKLADDSEIPPCL